MNKQIETLARKADMVDVEYHPGFPEIKYPKNYEKFAESVVLECIKAFESEVDTWHNISEHKGAIKRQGAKAIKKHFGIET